MLRVTLEVPFRCFLRRLVGSKGDEDDFSVRLLQLLKSALNRALHKVLVNNRWRVWVVLVSCSSSRLLLQPDQPFFELLALQNTRVVVEQPTDFGCLAWGEFACRRARLRCVRVAWWCGARQRAKGCAGRNPAARPFSRQRCRAGWSIAPSIREYLAGPFRREPGGRGSHSIIPAQRCDHGEGSSTGLTHSRRKPRARLTEDGSARLGIGGGQGNARVGSLWLRSTKENDGHMVALAKSLRRKKPKGGRMGT